MRQKRSLSWIVVRLLVGSAAEWWRIASGWAAACSESGLYWLVFWFFLDGALGRGFARFTEEQC